MKRYYTITEAAKELYLSHQSIRTYAKAFGFYLHKKPGATMRLRECQFDKIKQAIELRRQGTHTVKGAVLEVKNN